MGVSTGGRWVSSRRRLLSILGAGAIATTSGCIGREKISGELHVRLWNFTDDAVSGQLRTLVADEPRLDKSITLSSAGGGPHSEQVEVIDGIENEMQYTIELSGDRSILETDVVTCLRSASILQNHDRRSVEQATVYVKPEETDIVTEDCSNA